MNRIILVAAVVVIAVAAGAMVAGCKPKEPVAKTEPCAVPDGAAVAEGAKLEIMLKLWDQGKKDEAVAALLAADWPKPVTLGGKTCIFEMAEKDFSSMTTGDRQKFWTETLDPVLQGVKGLINEVYARAMQAVGEKDYEGAEKSLQSGVGLGRMMNHGKEQLIVVRLVGIAVEGKMLKGMKELYTQSGQQEKLEAANGDKAKLDAQLAEIKKNAGGR